MSTQIQFQSFNFQSSAVRVITDPTGEFWFCGKDVCTILGYVNESLTLQKHCKENGVSKRYLIDKMQRKQEAIFINEPNLYRIIFRSNKSQAIDFQNWVFEEVLPQIRKTGKYSVQQELALPEPDKTFNLETTESTARDLIWALFATAQMHTLLGNLEPALQAIGSNFHPMVYSHHREYAPQIKTAVDFMKQLIQPFKESNDLDWQRLVHNLERIEAEQQNAQQKRAKHLPYRHF